MTSSPRVVLLEPTTDAASAWYPFHGARPIADLRAGALRIRERWCRALAAELLSIAAAPFTTSFIDIESLPIAAEGDICGPCIVVRSDVAPALTPIAIVEGTRRLTLEGRTVGWVLGANERWTGRTDEGAALEIAGMELRGAFDLVTAIERLLADDITALRGAATILPPDALVLGDSKRLECRSARVEPGVVFDLRNGSILIEADVEIRHGARLEGPLYVASGSRLLGGAIRGSSIGPACTVHGELAASCLIGYANKGHDGFVGHSVLGHWVNLGAGTITSNLKNTYGPVRLDPPGGRIDTGRQFLGTLFGDHAKTAIGTMCGTGTLVGAGANVFGGPAPKCVVPLAWGADGAARMDRAGFLATASRVLPRRQISWTDAHAATLGALHDRLTGG